MRHAFSRWGEQSKYSVNSKMNIIKYHPWWYRKLSDEDLKETFLAHKVGELLQGILDHHIIEHIGGMCILTKAERQKVIENLKNEYLMKGEIIIESRGGPAPCL